VAPATRAHDEQRVTRPRQPEDLWQDDVHGAGFGIEAAHAELSLAVWRDLRVGLEVEVAIHDGRLVRLPHVTTEPLT
jgi:hypothetical protein